MTDGKNTLTNYIEAVQQICKLVDVGSGFSKQHDPEAWHAQLTNLTRSALLDKRFGFHRIKEFLGSVGRSGNPELPLNRSHVRRSADCWRSHANAVCDSPV